MGMRKTLTDPVKEKVNCIRNARQFLLASACCTSYQPESEAALVLPWVPAVVNVAFAVELAFKAILLGGLQKGDPPPKGHGLKDLFNQLSPGIQASLRADVPPPSYPKLEQPSPDPFLDALTAHADAFVEWRYLHEDDTAELAASVPFLSRLAEAALALA